jgi:hypothetical protein
MQLIMENWRQFTEGAQLDRDVQCLLESYGVTPIDGHLSLDLLEEGLKDEIRALARKYGKKAVALAVAGALGFAAGASTGPDEPDRITTVSPDAADF